MRLFINSGICDRKWNGNVSIRQKKGIVTLRIPEYSEETLTQKHVEFVIPNLKRRMLRTNTWVLNLKLQEEASSKERFIFTDTYDPYVGGIYALLRSTVMVPDDIFIPADKKDKIKVIRRIRFVDGECDLGNFLSNVYFVKIMLDRKEKLPVYLTYDNARWVRKYIMFSRNAEGNWNAQQESKDKNIYNSEGQYISLSELM